MSTLNVRFHSAAAEVHRIRNFAEDLEHRLHSEQSGAVQNVDTAIDHVVVSAGSTRLFGKVLAATRAVLKRHNLLAEATLERE